MTTANPAKTYDPRDLIGEALRMEPLAIEEYRSIFFDWAFGLREHDAGAAAAALLAHYSGAPQDHPMLGLLREAAKGAGAPRGRRGRIGRAAAMAARE